VISDHDDVLTNPDFQPYFHSRWTLGMEHDPVEPNSVLLPARVDAPASNLEGTPGWPNFLADSRTSLAVLVLRRPAT
jgi:hypothetical protein